MIPDTPTDQIPAAAELRRKPGDWRPHGRRDTADEPLTMQQVGPALDGDRPGWIEVTGYRLVADEPAVRWVQVLVREDCEPPPPTEQKR